MKNFVIEFSNNEWTLYQYKEDMSNLPDIKGKEAQKLARVPSLGLYENRELRLNAEWDNIEQKGYINFKYYGKYATYLQENKIKNLWEFRNKLNNIDDMLEDFKTDVLYKEYEYKYPYESRGLSIRDFI